MFAKLLSCIECAVQRFMHDSSVVTVIETGTETAFFCKTEPKMRFCIDGSVLKWSSSGVLSLLGIRTQQGLEQLHAAFENDLSGRVITELTNRMFRTRRRRH